MRLYASILLVFLFCSSGLTIDNDIRKLLQFCRPEDGFHSCEGQCMERLYIRWDYTGGYGYGCTGAPRCSDDEFLCRINPKCVPRKFFNTRKGCVTKRMILPCRSNEFTCRKSRLCIPRSDVHDTSYDCNTIEMQDSSDEVGEPLDFCSRMEFRCVETERCIPRDWVLDGVKDCPINHKTREFGSDEMSMLPECHSDEEFRCQESGRCLMRYRVMDGFPDCSDKSDEIQPLMICNDKTEFRCEGSGRCIPRSWLMDGAENCKDGSDERMSRNYKCVEGEFKCRNGQRCIPDLYKCDGLDNCGDCSDEIEACDSPTMFRCPGDPNGTCIPQSYTCDLNPDCPKANDNPSYQPGFKCKNQNIFGELDCIVPQWMLQDDHSICADQSDLCFVDGKFVCARCLDNSQIISKRQICDGIIDCTDLSDECFCSNDESGGVGVLCDHVCYGLESTPCETCQIGEILCKSEKKCLNSSQVCDGIIHCEISKLDEKYCTKSNNSHLPKDEGDFTCQPMDQKVMDVLGRQSGLNILGTVIRKYGNKCDGIIECALFDDECGCPNEPKACKDIELNNITYLQAIGLPSFPVRTCNDFKYVDCCDYFGYLLPISLCNGIKECPDGEDEKVCPDDGQRFECDVGNINWITGVKSVISIDMNKTCDLTIDCLNSMDEMNCSTETHFYCHKGQTLFVPSHAVRDGKQDCQDNSDECSQYAFEKEDDPFASPEQMISIGFLRYFVWIMAFVAIFGNMGVIAETYFSEMRSKSSQSTAMGACNRNMIINLALSDFLMGIALLVIGIKSSMFSGIYCSEEKLWRTSGVCNFIGVLTILSSETSVFTLGILTFYRLYGVYKPYQSRNLKKNRAMLSLACSWLLAALFALVPLIPKLNQDMVTHVLTEPSKYFDSTTVSWNNMHEYSYRILCLNRSDFPIKELVTWGIAIDELKKNHYDYLPKIMGYFGFYSAHGVCIPRLFRSENSPPLHPLSLFIISINFCFLILITVSYYFIYRKSTRGKIAGNSTKKEKSNQEMQKKITILIATDICCWLPICIMTFLSQAGIAIPPQGYAICAIILLPINSCLNPIIYSNGFRKIRNLLCGEKLKKKLTTRKRKAKESSDKQSVMEMQNVKTSSPKQSTGRGSGTDNK